MNAATQSTPIPPPFVPFVGVPLYCGEKACAELSPVAFKLYYHIVRMTRGWKQRVEAAISYEEFKRACGIKANSTISKALKELVSKGFVAVFKHTGSYGGKATSSYFLLDAAPKTARSPRSSRAPRPERNWTPPWQESRNTPPARVSPPAAAQRFPPLGVVMTSAPFPPDPFEESEKTRARDIHAQLDQIELPSFQEQREVEEEEAEEEREEATCRETDSRKQELRAALETLTRECDQAYCRMASSAWGTRQRDESKQLLMRLRVEQQQMQMQLRRLERV